MVKKPGISTGLLLLFKTQMGTKSDSLVPSVRAAPAQLIASSFLYTGHLRSLLYEGCGFLGLTLALSLSIYADALSIFLQNWKLFQSRDRNGQFWVNTSTGSCSAIIRCFGLSSFPKDQRTLRTTFGWTHVCPKIHTNLCRCHPCSKCPTGSFLFWSTFSMYITLINMQCKLYVDIGSYCGWLHITWLLSIWTSFLIILLWFRPFHVGNAIESAMSKNPHHFHRKQ